MMQANQNTEDQISSWAAKNYGTTPAVQAAAAGTTGGMLAAGSPGAPGAAAAPASTSTWAAATSPASSGGTSSTTTPATPPASTWAGANSLSAPTTTPASTTPPASTPGAAGSTNVANWYQNELGRTAAPNETAYWQSRLDSGADPEALYGEFTADAKTNGENVTPTSWAAANGAASAARTPSATTGGQITPATTPAAPATTPGAAAAPAADSNANVVDWYLNTLGRVPSATEVQYWQNRINSGDNPQALYSEFTNDAVANKEQTVNPMSWAAVNSYTPVTSNNAQPIKLDPASLAVRTVDPSTETVAGNVNRLLDENSPVLQAAQAAAMRAAAARGMQNSVMAASGGTEAMIQHAESIGGADATTYNNADNYNVTAKNQALMTNTQNAQALQQLQLQLQDSAASRANQMAQAQLSANTTMSTAQLQQQTAKYQADLSANTSKYSTDQSFQTQMNAQKETLVNAILNNMDLSPDRKAAMLQSLGEGTSASGDTPGTGLAGAVYVIGSTSADLAGGTSATTGTTGASGPVGSMMENVAAQARAQQ